MKQIDIGVKGSDGDYGGALKSSFDVGMGGVGLLGPAGFVVSSIYFIFDQTAGWNSFGMSDATSKSYWNAINSGRMRSKMLDR